MSRKLLFLVLGLSACAPSAVGVWSGETSGCDDPADDGAAVTVSIANATDGEARLDLLTTVALDEGGAASCTGEAVPVDDAADDLDVDYALDCGGVDTDYRLEATVDGDEMSGDLSWDDGGCAVTLAR